MVWLVNPKALNTIVAHIPGVVWSVAIEADKVGARAEVNLSTVRSTTTHTKLDQKTAHLTKIEVEHHDVDSLIVLHAPNALALEFGHDPSGAFGPGRSKNRMSQSGVVMSAVGTFGHGSSKAPEGQYILYRAAGLI